MVGECLRMWSGASEGLEWESQHEKLTTLRLLNAKNVGSMCLYTQTAF